MPRKIPGERERRPLMSRSRPSETALSPHRGWIGYASRVAACAIILRPEDLSHIWHISRHLSENLWPCPRFLTITKVKLQRRQSSSADMAQRNAQHWPKNARCGWLKDRFRLSGGSATALAERE